MADGLVLAPALSLARPCVSCGRTWRRSRRRRRSCVSKARLKVIMEWKSMGAVFGDGRLQMGRGGNCLFEEIRNDAER